MSYKTIRPTGLSIKRHNNYFVISWKITDKDYGEGQTLQYRFPKGKWRNIVIGNATTKKTLTLPATDYYPYTKKTLGKLFVRIRGRRKDFKKDDKNKTTVNPEMSDWTQKDYDVMIPMRPSLSAALSSSANNVTTFTWKTVTDVESSRWFSRVQCQTRLEQNSTIVDGSKLSATGWTHHSFGSANGSATITEDSSVINRGVSYTRWFRVRSQGPQGHSEWAYARHVYAVPYQTKDVKATAKQTEAGGYLCTATWKTPKNSAHPVDKINIQYCYAQPVDGMQCPDGVTWTDAETLAYKDGSDASSVSIDSTVGTDQCMFVRINTVHDRNTTYGYPVIAAVGSLAAPTGLTIDNIDTSTFRVTVIATNTSQVQDSFLAVKYMTADDPNGFIIGIIPHGQTTITVQCPAFASSNALRFGAMAVVGSYTETVRGDSVSSYAIKTQMRSALVEYGGSVPAAPGNVALAQTGTVGAVRVTFDWAWQQATAAELSWADHEDAWESTDGPTTYMINNTHASAWNISGLQTGKTWYIRVRLASGVGENQTFGAYSEIASIDLSSAPAIPILTLSDSVITEDGSVTASWAFSSTDGSAQASAEVAEVDNGTYTTLAVVESIQHVTISAEDAGWTSGETHSLVVRVVSESGRQSAGWSDPVSVTVAEPITAEITQISLVEQTLTEDGVQRTVMSLTEMPLTITVEGAGIGGTTRVVIERTETYHLTRPDETDYNGFEGETIAIYTQTGEDQISIGLDDLIGHLDDGAAYRLIATVQDGLGQSYEVVQPFEVHWTHQALMPDAFVYVRQSEAVAVLNPIAPEGALTTDVCDIYRLSVDKPELIYPDAVFGETYVDPYPTIGEHGGHRFVFRTANGDYITENDELAWVDMTESEGDTLYSDANIIDFGAGRVVIEYNADLSNSWRKDFTETKYLGGSVQGDWNPAVSRTGSISAVAVTDDIETIEAMRRLAVYPGICHVRTKDGSSYAADVQVSESHKQSNGHRIVEFSLSITRVDAEVYDGLTLAEWQQTGGVYD